MERHEGGIRRKPKEGKIEKLSLQRNEQRYKTVDGLIR